MDRQTAQIYGAARKAFQQGDYQRALRLTDSVEARSPDLAALYLLRGQIHRRQEEYDAAAKAYIQVTELLPGYVGARFNLGNIRFQQDRYPEALDWYQAELHLLAEKASDGVNQELAKQQQTTRLQIARAYARMGKSEEAVDAYKDLIARDSTNALAYGDLGQYLERLGRFDAASRYIRRAVQLDPRNIEYRYHLGEILVRQQQYEEAVPHLKKVVDQRPWHAGALYNLGQAYVQLRETERASTLLARADSMQSLQSQIDHARLNAKGDPQNPTRWVRLGQLLRATGQYSEAIDAYRRAAKLNPEDADIWYQLGRAYKNMNRPGEARQAFNRALRVDPDHKGASVARRRMQ